MYGQVEEVLSVMSKAGITTGDIILQVTMSCKYFMEIPDTLTYCNRMILVIVEGR